MTLEEMLRAPAETLRSYDARTWETLVQHVVDRLIEWLGYELEVESMEDACVADGFSLDVVRACPTRNELMYWKGILGASVIEGRLRVSLVVFLYSGEHRLINRDGTEYMEYVYEARDSVGGQWTLYGWFRDTYGEYGGF